MGVFGSIIFLIGGLMSVIGLLLLIPNKTRSVGKKITITFVIVCALGYLIGFFGNADNSSTGAKTKSDPILDVKTKSNASITANDLKKVKLGDSYKHVEKTLGNPKKVDKQGYMWEYGGKNALSPDSYAVIKFDEGNYVESIEQSGIIEKDTTRIDKDGVNNFDHPEKSTGIYKSDGKDNDIKTTNKDYADYVRFDIEDAIGDKVDWNGKKKNTVREVEVNDNMGKQDGSKLILVRLNAPVEMTNKFTKEKVNEQTLEIAKAIKNDPTVDFKIDSITYFWYLPLTDQYGNTKADTAYKISLEKSTLDKINFKHLENVDLPAIADQYNVLYNE
ncbi:MULTISPECIES: hypothetical protein [Bacillus]|uniref:hypothetical protein n=1 Tax=Bacillus TaxID=1386 RepID=UPI002E22BFC3|nr:hypothetical protein [Bacillus smithii]MED4928159.1 hypothetical protein [Bacillus smithii]